MPGRALDEPTLASDALSRGLSSFGPAISTVTLIQGAKRKASNMENVEAPQGASQTCPPIKLEPGSPNDFDYRGSYMRDIHPELYEMPTGYGSSSSTDYPDDQMLEIHQDESTVTMGPSRKPLAAEVRLDMRSRNISVPSKMEAETHTARVALQNEERGTNGLLRPMPMLDNFPPPRRQKASGRPEDPRHYSGNKFDDVDYNSIPDYAPPISTLPRGNPHILQVQWRKKTFVDLSNDLDRHMLHEVELKLATSLNLSCAKYICTKRRIFQARFEVLQAGREFKKSDSQKACKINSNKAGKLCGAFEKVGWFDKKYFLEYLDESNNPLRKANNENENRGSPSSGLTEPDIWDVSESEFYFTSEGDEESTDDDTADSSVSFNGRHDENEARRNLNSYRDNSMRKQDQGLSLIGGDGSQRRVLNDRTFQKHNTLSVDETVDEGPMLEDRRPRRGVVVEETVYPRSPDGLSGDDTEEVPVLETRSMTQKIKLALNSHSGDKSSTISTTETKSSQQKSSLDKFHRRAAPARNPIPHSLDEANAADIMLVEMKEKGRPWLEIEEAWENKTGKAQTTKSLSCRYTRIMANLASTRLKSDEVHDSGRSLTYTRLEQDDDQLLLAAEAEIEGNFQREKADIIAEIESNFQSEKWNLVAEAMSRTGSAHYSAELIQAQYEKLTRDPKRVDAKDEENDDTFTDLPRRMTRTVSGRKTETSTPSRSGVGRLDEASNATSLPHPQHPWLLLHQKGLDSRSQVTTTIHARRSANRSRKCERCGRKYKSHQGLIYHHAHHPHCELTIPRSYMSKKRKLNSYSNPGHTQPRADRQGPFANPPAPRVSFPNLMPRKTPRAPPQVDRIDNAPAPEDVSLGPSAEGVEHGRQKVRKDPEQSARMRRVWAIRRARGTNGRNGGPPKAKKAEMAASNTASNAGIPLATTVTTVPHQSGQPPDLLPTRTEPIVFEKEVRRDANQNKQSFEQIIPAASQTDTSPERIKPFRKQITKRHTCRKCGMSYANRANHYRVFPKIGSEHRRRMAANNAAAEGSSGPATTDVGVESTSDILTGQMVFEIPSREQSPEMLMSREDREFLGEDVE